MSNLRQQTNPDGAPDPHADLPGQGLQGPARQVPPRPPVRRGNLQPRGSSASSGLLSGVHTLAGVLRSSIKSTAPGCSATPPLSPLVCVCSSSLDRQPSLVGRWRLTAAEEEAQGVNLVADLDVAIIVRVAAVKDGDLAVVGDAACPHNAFGQKNVSALAAVLRPKSLGKKNHFLGLRLTPPRSPRAAPRSPRGRCCRCSRCGTSSPPSACRDK